MPLGEKATWRGPAAGSELTDGGIVRSERALGGIETVNENRVETQVGNKDETIVWRNLNPVGVRSFLALLVGAESAGILDVGGVFAEFAVGKNGKDDHVAGGIVRGEKIFAGFVEGKIARIFTESGELIELRELGGLGIEREGGDGAVLAGFVGGVGELAAGMNGHPGRTGRFRGEAFAA